MKKAKIQIINNAIETYKKAPVLEAIMLRAILGYTFKSSHFVAYN